MIEGGKIGRYLVIDELGAGGMGVVYGAYDPQLNRRIAIKLLHQQVGGAAEREENRKRLMREAQAMARLSHPQVIAIHDIGTFGEQVFITMDFVEGGTLKSWLRERPRTQAEILEKFILAGRGLSAAHAVGLVHRDFKPDNVLIGKDGRVYVTDFGLAREAAVVEDVQEAGELLDRAEGVDPQLLNTPLTRTDVLVGTPMYMAPEQFQKGAVVDARSDEFSFCVALFEALYGSYPFAGSSLLSLAYRVMSGKLEPIPDGAKVPSWLRQVLLRGLSTNPQQRYPNMDALLSALSRDQRRERLRYISAAALAVFALLGGAGAYSFLHRQTPCRGAERKLLQVWDDPRKQAVRGALLATGKAYAQESAQRVEETLNRYTEQWVRMHTETCQATYVRHEQSAAVLDLRMLCLDRRLADVEALTKLLSTSDATLVDKAAKAARELTPLSECVDVAPLTAPVPLPTDVEKRQRVLAVQRQLSEVEALHRLGQYPKAQARTEALLPVARELGHQPLLAEVMQRRGVLLHIRGQNQEATETLLAAGAAAVAGRDLRMAARVWTWLSVHSGINLGQAAEARKWQLLADAALEALGGNAEARAQLLLRKCQVERQHPTEQTLSLCQEALDAMTKLYGPVHHSVAEALISLANVHGDRGQLEESLRYSQQALAVQEQHLGPSNPIVAIYMNNVGSALAQLRRYREGLPYLQRALELQERGLEPNHPQKGVVLGTLGALQWGDGQMDQAHRSLERAIQILGKTFPERHPYILETQLDLCRIHLAAQHHGDAQRLAETVLRGVEQLGPDSPLTADAHFLLGQALLRQGQHAAALPRHQQALALYEKMKKEEACVRALAAIGVTLFALKRAEEALPQLERAVQRGAAKSVPPDALAAAQFGLAKLLWSSGRDADRERARALIKSASSAYANTDPKLTFERAELSAWKARAAP